MTNTNSEIIAKLKQASEGLLFMSESEYPFLVFLWSGIAPRTCPGGSYPGALLSLAMTC